MCVGLATGISLSVTHLYKLCLDTETMRTVAPRRWPSAPHLPASHFPYIQGEIPGNPPFCRDLWVSVFCSEVHSKYFH